jgi:hypothetical protein
MSAIARRTGNRGLRVSVSPLWCSPQASGPGSRIRSGQPRASHGRKRATTLEKPLPWRASCSHLCELPSADARAHCGKSRRLRKPHPSPRRRDRGRWIAQRVLHVDPLPACDLRSSPNRPPKPAAEGSQPAVPVAGCQSTPGAASRGPKNRMLAMIIVSSPPLISRRPPTSMPQPTDAKPRPADR